MSRVASKKERKGGLLKGVQTRKNRRCQEVPSEEWAEKTPTFQSKKWEGCLSIQRDRLTKKGNVQVSVQSGGFLPAGERGDRRESEWMMPLPSVRRGLRREERDRTKRTSSIASVRGKMQEEKKIAYERLGMQKMRRRAAASERFS